MKIRIKRFTTLMIIIVIISFILVFYIDKKITPIIMDYSVEEVKKIISIIINRSINSDILEHSNLDNMYTISQSDKGDILSLNSVIVNHLTDIISDVLEDSIILIEEEKYDDLQKHFNISKDYFFIPSSLIFSKGLLAFFGYNIPIKLKMLGNVSSGINTDIREYGLNNSLITISISVSVEMMVLLPFDRRTVNFNNNIPISIKLIQGSVPNFYNNYK